MDAVESLTPREKSRADTKSVLVTGASGLVGRAVAKACSEAGWSVRGIDMIPGPWTSTVADIREWATIRDATKGVAAVIHIAALHAPHVGDATTAEFHPVNVDATEVLIDAAIGAGVPQLIYTSSTSVYGRSLEPVDRAVWVNEALDVQPRDIYDETKLAAEALVSAAELPTTILRIARCFARRLRRWPRTDCTVALALATSPARTCSRSRHRT